MKDIDFNKDLIKTYKSFLAYQSPLYDEVSKRLKVNNINYYINTKGSDFNSIYKRQLLILIRHIFSYNSINVRLYRFNDFNKDSCIFNYLFYDFCISEEYVYIQALNIRKLSFIYSNYVDYNLSIAVVNYLNLYKLIYNNPILLKYIKQKKLWIVYLKYRFPKIFRYL